MKPDGLNRNEPTGGLNKHGPLQKESEGRAWQWYQMDFGVWISLSTHIVELNPPLELPPLVFPRSETRGVLIQKSGRRPGNFGDLVWFPHWKTFRNMVFTSIFWFYEHWFQNFSPAALLKLLKYSILIKSPPQAKIFLASGRIFELKPPLFFPDREQGGVLIQRYGLIDVPIPNVQGKSILVQPCAVKSNWSDRDFRVL